MKINKEINFQIDAIDFIYKKYCNNDYEKTTYDKLSERGVSIERIDELFGDYIEFKDRIYKQINVPKDLISYFLMEYQDGSRLLVYFYQKYSVDTNIDYQAFLESFIKQYLYEGPISQPMDLPMILNIINELNINDSDKLAFINLYLGGFELFKKILIVIEEVANIIKDHFSLIQNDVEDIYNKIQEKEQLVNYLNEYINIDKIMKGDVEVTLLVSFYNQISLTVENGKNHIFLGYLGVKLNQLKKDSTLSEKRLMNVLKVISDPTRFKILQILKQGETFGNDIAKRVELTPATVNHHLNVLVNEQLLKAEINENDNKKIFYQLQPQKIEEVIDVLRRILL